MGNGLKIAQQMTLTMTLYLTSYHCDFVWEWRILKKKLI